MTQTELLRKDFEIKEILYKQANFCKCYTTYQSGIIFEMLACGYDLTYALSGHSYEPVLYAECSIPRFSFIIHDGLWFPSGDDNGYGWEDFCRDIGMEITLHVAWLHNLPQNYMVDFSALKKGQTELLYNGQSLWHEFFPIRDLNLPYLEPVLFVERPNPKNLPKKTHSAGFPGEYHIYISELSLEEKEKIQTTDGKQIITKKDVCVLYPIQHPKYGNCYVCSENIDGHWVDGYYVFNENGILTRVGNAR